MRHDHVEEEKSLPTQAYPINPPRLWPINNTPNIKSKMNMTVALLATNHAFLLPNFFWLALEISRWRTFGPINKHTF
jgi:hypothetical protein